MNNKTLQVYNYEGSNITFKTENGTWVNATEMAKPFGKRPIEWLRLPSSNDFLDALFKVRNGEGKVGKSHFENTPYFGFVVTERGGVNPCTWFHEDVALEFARWLAPAFAVWCNDRIKEMLTGRGVQTPFANMSAAEISLIAIDAYSRENGRLRQQITGLQTRLHKYAKEFAKIRESKAEKVKTRNRLLLEAPEYFSQFLGQTDLFDEPNQRVKMEDIWIAFQTFVLGLGVRNIPSRRSLGLFLSNQPLLGKGRTNNGVYYCKL